MTPRVDQHLVHARSPKTVHSQRGSFQFAGGNYPQRSDSHDIRGGVENARKRRSVSNAGGRTFMYCLQLPMAKQWYGVPLRNLLCLQGFSISSFACLQSCCAHVGSVSLQRPFSRQMKLPWYCLCLVPRLMLLFCLAFVARVVIAFLLLKMSLSSPSSPPSRVWRCRCCCYCRCRCR